MSYIQLGLYVLTALIAILLSATLAEHILFRLRERRRTLFLLYSVYHAAWHMADNSEQYSAENEHECITVMLSDFERLSEAMEELERQFPPGNNIHTLYEQLR